MDGKRPQPSWRPGQVKQSGIGGYSALPALHQLRRDCRAEHPLVGIGQLLGYGTCLFGTLKPMLRTVDGTGTERALNPLRADEGPQG